LAVAFAEHYPTVGFDINRKRIGALQEGLDHTQEMDCCRLQAALSSTEEKGLTLTDDRINEMISGIETVIAMTDPVGKSNQLWTLENGLEITKITVPIGVIAIIYEIKWKMIDILDSKEGTTWIEFTFSVKIYPSESSKSLL